MTFGELLRRHRMAAGIAQESLAERAALSVETISALERGARQKPYVDTIALLARALGLSPDDRAELERAASRRSARSQAPANNLPAHISSFVGRDHDVAKVGQILSDHRLLTLVGPGGVGKTRLALRVAELTESKRDGIWFVDLSPISNAARIVSAIAAGIGLSQSASLDGLIDFLRSKALLLILDNCEHLVGDVALTVDAVLHACTNVTILATSREPLSTEGERVYRVPPLAPDDAVKLFAERAEAADSGFEFTDSVKHVVSGICELLDGIALGIELVAARTSAVSLRTVAAELREHLQFSQGRRRTVVSRQQTMEALFDWSFGLLSEREKRVFRGVSVFVGGFSRELAVAVCSGPEASDDVVTEALGSLVTKSLVQSEPNGATARYRLLEPARQYAREKLAERNEERDALRAHALALLALADPIDSSLELTSDRVWDSMVQPERENFRAAAEWSMGKSGDIAIAQRLVGSMTVMWYGLMSGEAQRSMIESALASCDENTPQPVRARIELAAARCATEFASDARSALLAAERALGSQPADDARGIASAQYLVGLGLSRCGRIAESEAAFKEALLKARSVGAQATIAAATASLGAARLMADDINQARALVREALQLHRDAKCERLGAATAAHLAEIEFAAGQAEAALALSQDASDFYREERNWWLLAFVLTNQSAYSVALHRYDQARSEAREALLVAQRIGLRRSTSWAVQHLAAIAGFRNHPKPDRNDIRRSAKLLGFVDEVYSRSGAIRERTEQLEYEKLLVALREVLDEKALERAMAEGKTWSEDRAVAEALEV